MSDEEKGLLRPQGKTRSALSQVLLLGAICFCVPGMWNSITSMAGGIEDQAVVSTATAWLYGCFAVTSILAPVANNKLGSRATLFLGTLGYLIYVVSLWCALCPDMLPRMHSITPRATRCRTYARTGGTFVVVAGAINGVCAALLWTAQGTLIMSYPSKDTKGIYLSYFWIIFNIGAVCYKRRGSRTLPARRARWSSLPAPLLDRSSAACSRLRSTSPSVPATPRLRPPPPPLPFSSSLCLWAQLASSSSRRPTASSAPTAALFSPAASRLAP